MKKLIDRDGLYKALAQWDWQDLYLPVHFKELVDELPAVDGNYTEQDVRDSYNDGFSMGVQRGYEDAVLHYAKMALKQWIPCTERLPSDYVLFCDLDGDMYCGRCIDNNWMAVGCDDRIKNVIAWMPLPEPYEEDEDGREKMRKL